MPPTKFHLQQVEEERRRLINRVIRILSRNKDAQKYNAKVTAMNNIKNFNII